MKTLQDLFLNELADVYDAEQRILKSLPKLAEAATNPELREAFENHVTETEGQISRLEQVFQLFGQPAKGQTCEATVGLIKEAEEILSDFEGSIAINAALIAAAQKVEHYEIASYGCLREWAALLGNDDAADLLQETLEEEEAANKTLTMVAETDANDEALGEKTAEDDEGDDEDDEAEDDEATTKSAGTSAASDRGDARDVDTPLTNKIGGQPENQEDAREAEKSVSPSKKPKTSKSSSKK